MKQDFFRIKRRGIILINELEQTTCKRCGRKLKNPKAIELGMGATCWKKFIEEDIHKKLFECTESPTNKQE
jgi:DNA-directed RNA polymerase subunit RPC12/RpoP